MALAFQLEDENLRRIFEYYNLSKDKAFMILPLVGVCRYILALKGGVEDQFNVFKDVVICCLLLACFASFIRLGMELPIHISNWLNLGEVSVNVDPAPGDRFSMVVSSICRVVTYAAYVISKFIYYASLLILCFLAAWVIIGVTMTSFFGALVIFMVVFLFVCLIPTFWTLVNAGTKLLFDPKDPDWNNSILVISAAGKALLTWLSFKKALYEPFLQKFHEASKSIIQKGAQTASLVAGGAGLGAKAIGAVGGQKYLNAGSNALSALKNNGLRVSQQTVPTAEKIISSVGASAMNGFNKTAPKVSDTLKRGAAYFQNKADPYNQRPIAGSSPFNRTLASNSSFSLRKVRLSSSSPSSSGSVPSDTIGGKKKSNVKIAQPHTIPSLQKTSARVSDQMNPSAALSTRTDAIVRSSFVRVVDQPSISPVSAAFKPTRKVRGKTK